MLMVLPVKIFEIKNKHMSLSLDAYRAKLVIKILYAKKTDNVERYIDTAIRALVNRKVNGHIIVRFIDKIINQLESIFRAAPDEQKANIAEAKNCFTRIKDEVTTPANY